MRVEKQIVKHIFIGLAEQAALATMVWPLASYHRKKLMIIFHKSEIDLVTIYRRYIKIKLLYFFKMFT